MNALVLQHGDWGAARGTIASSAPDVGPHLGVQFHPESTIEIAKPAAQAAFDLFDAFWERTRT